MALAIGVAGPQVTSAVYGSKDKSCPISERFENYGNFLQSLISPLDFKEYIKDLFQRNFCHQYDIEILEAQLDKLRKQIRQAFYTCKNDKAESLAVIYRKTYVELMYMRQFVTYNSGEGGSITPNPSVKSDLTDYFVFEKNWYDEEEFEGVIEKIAGKYNAERYIDCKDDVWAELLEKFGEFKEVLTNTAQGFKKQVEDKWEKANRAPYGDKWNESFFNDRLGFYVNDVPPEHGEGFLTEIFSEEEMKRIEKEIFENTPGTGIDELSKEQKDKLGVMMQEKNITVFEYLDAVNKAEEEFDRGMDKAEMLAEYSFLYKDSADYVIQELVGKLNRAEYCDKYYKLSDGKKPKPADIKKCKEVDLGLLDIIKVTFPTLEQVKACSTQIRDKQCKNKG